jgi:uncharacterized protein
VNNGSMEPVTFVNSKGDLLFGILHEPIETNDANNDTCILLLSPGVKMRVAPHRLYIDMAENFITEGFSVLRFDFWGLGDSEGDFNETYLADLYGEIQIGCYVNDTRCAMDWLSNVKGFSKFILGGLCGGAITALLTGAEDNRCVGLLSIGIPVILDSQNIDKNKYLTQWQKRSLRLGYFRNLFNLNSWYRLLTLKSDFHLILQLLFFSNDSKSSTKDNQNNQAKKGNVNPFFAPKFFDLLSRQVNVILIFSGSDRLLYEFNEKFIQQYKDRFDMYSDQITQHVIPNANHILSNTEWKTQMINFSSDWLKTIYTHKSSYPK